MSCLLRHRLRNNTDRTLYLREMHIGGFGLGWTRLDPYETKGNFPAAMYFNHGRLLRTVCMVAIFVDNYMAFGGLTPLQFLAYFELIFDIDEGSHTLIVSGIQSESTDYFPCRYLPLWNCFKDSGRLRDIVMITGFKAVKAKNDEGGRLDSSQDQMMTINVMINYDGERKKTEEGGFIWSSGAHAKWRAISVDENNLTLDGVAEQICAALGFNPSQTKLMFCSMPESYATHPCYIRDSQTLKDYLTFSPKIYKTIPKLHVKMVETSTKID